MFCYYIDKSAIVSLVDIYDKSTTSSISKEELIKIIKNELD
jgi:Ca2+-binding EF-hand superfamily protein